jgi:quercetin dioxygenase-like cupin family protein
MVLHVVEMHSHKSDRKSASHDTKHVHRKEVEADPVDKVIIRVNERKPYLSQREGGPRTHFEFPTRSIDIHLSEIPAGETSVMHRHYNEGLIYILKGKGYSEIGGKRVEWSEGDVLFIPVWNWHRHYADPSTPVTYLAATNQPTLQAMGLHLTDERGKITHAELTKLLEKEKQQK